MDEQEAGSLAGWGDVILTGKEVADQIENMKYQPKSVQKAKQSDGVFSARANTYIFPNLYVRLKI